MQDSIKIRDDAHEPRESVPPQDVDKHAGSMKETSTEESDIGSKTTILKTDAQNGKSAITTIDSLAEELIDNIMANLRDEEDTKALAILSLVSKKFHRTVEPHLYHHITVVLGSSIFGGFAGNVKELIRTLFYNTHFRKWVRMLTVVRNEAESWIGDQVRDHDYLTYNLLSRGNDNHCDSYLVALVKHLPYLETLDMSQYLWADQARIPIFSECTCWSQKLKNVDISIRGEFSILALFCMFMLPSIESIAVRGGRIMPADTEENAGLWINSSSNSTVKNLMLKVLLYDPRELDFIAGLCTDLSSLNLYFSDIEGSVMLAYGDLYSFKNQMTSASMRQLSMVSSEYGFGFRIEVKDIPATLYSSRSLEDERQWDCLFFEGNNNTRDNFHLINFLRTLDLFDLVAAYSLTGESHFPNPDIPIMLIHMGLVQCVEAISFYPVPVSLAFMTKHGLDKEKIAKLKVSYEKNIQLNYVVASRDWK